MRKRQKISKQDRPGKNAPKPEIDDKKKTKKIQFRGQHKKARRTPIQAQVHIPVKTFAKMKTRQERNHRQVVVLPTLTEKIYIKKPHARSTK